VNGEKYIIKLILDLVLAI